MLATRAHDLRDDLVARYKREEQITTATSAPAPGLAVAGASAGIAAPTTTDDHAQPGHEDHASACR